MLLAPQARYVDQDSHSYQAGPEHLHGQPGIPSPAAGGCPLDRRVEAGQGGGEDEGEQRAAGVKESAALAGESEYEGHGQEKKCSIPGRQLI